MIGPLQADEGIEVVVMIRSFVPALVFVLSAAAVSAGDLAVLENLGFSPEGEYFMFGQHVLETDAGLAYAETGIIEVESNTYVSGGWKKASWNVPILPNQDSRGALYELLTESSDTKELYGIDHLEQGRLLYTRSNGDDELAEEDGKTIPTLNFRDFEWGREYSLALHQEVEGENENVQAAFFIEVTVKDPSGRETSYTVGRPGYMRAGIAGYRVVRVWLGPDGKSVVIGVAKETPDLSVRYMMETFVMN